MTTEISIELNLVLARGYEGDITQLAADASPDERGELLYLAGAQWRRAEDLERAEQHLLTALELGPEPSASARVVLAEVRFDQGRDDEARELLRELTHIDAKSFWPYHRAAMTCEDRGYHRECLEFANLAFCRMNAESLAVWLTGGDADEVTPVLAIRRRARQALGMQSDDLDDSIEVILHSRRHLLGVGAQLSVTAPKDVEFAFWPRRELSRANALWPDLVTTTDLQFAALSRMNEDVMFRIHRGRVTLVPFTVAGLFAFVCRTGSDPMDKNSRDAYQAELIRTGSAISWPPGRNEQCWCGSSSKYKKCCGRPARPDTSPERLTLLW